MNEAKKIKVYELKEVCKELNIGLQVLRTYIKEGKIKASKIGRKYVITEESINEFLQANIVEPKKDLKDILEDLKTTSKREEELQADARQLLKEATKETLIAYKEELLKDKENDTTGHDLMLLDLINEEIESR